MQARMAKGRRPIVIETELVPEHPEYWHVPESYRDGVRLLAEDGQVELLEEARKDSPGYPGRTKKKGR